MNPNQIKVKRLFIYINKCQHYIMYEMIVPPYIMASKWQNKHAGIKDTL